MGLFSLSFKALSAHIDTLFDDIGGEALVNLLDELHKVPSKDRALLLSAFISITRELAEANSDDSTGYNGAGDDSEVGINLGKESDCTNLLVSRLCEEIINEITADSNRIDRFTRNLQVVPGGKARNSNVIQLSKFNVMNRNDIHPDLPTPPTPPFKPAS